MKFKIVFSKVAVIIVIVYMNTVNSFDFITNGHYLSRGYDSINGSLPCMQQTCLETVFRSNIFDFSKTFNDENCLFRIPIGSKCSKASSEVIGVQTKIYKSLTDVTQQTTQSEGSNVGYRRRFRNSQSYTTTTFTQSITSLDQTYFHTYVENLLYTLYFEDWRNIPLTAAFRSRVATLPVNYSYADYYQFISLFGTNFITKVVLGGRVQQFLFMQNSGLYTYTSQTYSAVESCQVHFFIKAGYNHSSSTTNTNMNSFNSFVGNEFFYSIPESQNAPFNISQWTKELKNNPIPINVEIFPLDYLLNSWFFPNDPDIKAKNSNLQQAISDYFPANSTACPPGCEKNASSNGCQAFDSYNVNFCDCTNGYFGSNCQYNFNIN